MPIIKHLDGNCHVYIDDAADLDKAHAIAVDAKTYRYGICGATTGLRTELHLGLLFSQQKEVYGVYMGTKEDMREIAEMLNRGAIKPVVDRTFALPDAAEAGSRNSAAMDMSASTGWMR